MRSVLQADDDAALEAVLGHADRTVISNTLARLPIRWLLPFLAKLVVRLQARPGRGAQLSAWLHALVTGHAGYLLTLPDLPDRLSGLYALLEGRLAPYKKLLRLEGRLGLVLAQVRRREAPACALLERRTPPAPYPPLLAGRGCRWKWGPAAVRRLRVRPHGKARAARHRCRGARCAGSVIPGGLCRSGCCSAQWGAL